VNGAVFLPVALPFYPGDKTLNNVKQKQIRAPIPFRLPVSALRKERKGKGENKGEKKEEKTRPPEENSMQQNQIQSSLFSHFHQS